MILQGFAFAVREPGIATVVRWSGQPESLPYPSSAQGTPDFQDEGCMRECGSDGLGTSQKTILMHYFDGGAVWREALASTRRATCNNTPIAAETEGRASVHQKPPSCEVSPGGWRECREHFHWSRWAISLREAISCAADWRVVSPKGLVGQTLIVRGTAAVRMLGTILDHVPLVLSSFPHLRGILWPW